MQNKLQELTDKLYNEGLSKGQQEAAELLEKAKAEAEQLIEAAKHNAEQIISKAEKQAEDIKKNANAEIGLAGRQVIMQVKQATENIITTKAIAEPNKSAFNDVDFVKQIIQSAIEGFSKSSDNNSQLSILLPDSQQEQLKTFVAGQIGKQMSNGIDVQFSKSIKSGFRIGAKEKGYYISFTDIDFETLFKEYLRPSVQQLLFGQEGH